MTRRRLMLLVATAMAVLLAGCGSSQKEDQGSSHGGSQREVGSSQQRPEPTTNETVVDRCPESGGTGGQQEEASSGEVANGKIAFTRSTYVNSDVYVVDEEGAHETRLTYTAQSFEKNPVWSPDAQKIAFMTQNGALYVMNADGTNETRLAVGLFSSDLIPSWSPDGQRIAFATGSYMLPSGLSVINADGTNEVSLISGSFSGNGGPRSQLWSPAWSPDGNKLAFAGQTVTDTGSSSSAEPASAPAEGSTGIYLINVDGTGLCKLTSTEDVLGYSPVWSPDGEQIAFYDKDTTNVINTDGSGRKPLAGGASAAWSPDGQKVAFINDSPDVLPGYQRQISVLDTINANGSGVRHLANTTTAAPGNLPAWSPDGEKIAFPCPAARGAAGTDLCVINADGTGLTRIASNVAPEASQYYVAPSWGRE
jgi:Tol biopolymer transport system component